eukprot:2848391-Pyramimonas_sp.AAC.1
MSPGYAGLDGGLGGLRGAHLQLLVGGVLRADGGGAATMHAGAADVDPRALPFCLPIGRLHRPLHLQQVVQALVRAAAHLQTLTQRHSDIE